MSTKLKIIIGFSSMVILLGIVLTISLIGINNSQNSFDAYGRLASFNVNMSDADSALSSVSSDVNAFLSSLDPNDMKSARANLDLAIDYLSKSIDFAISPERRTILETSIKRAKGMHTLLGTVESNRINARAVYNTETTKSITSLLDQFANTLSTGNRTGNQPVLFEVGQLSNLLGSVRRDLALYTSSRSIADANAVRLSLTKIKEGFTRLDAIMTSQLARRDFANMCEALDGVVQSFEKQEGIVKIAADNLRQLLSERDAILATISEMSAEVNTAAVNAERDARSANASVRNLVSVTGALGIIVGLVLAVLIISGLIRVLKNLSAYAADIAQGNFSKNETIKEPGEIGVVRDALTEIPHILEGTIARCNDAANAIAKGSFRERLDEDAFNGSFKTLGKSVNALADSYTRVIDSLPVGVMTATTEHNLTFMNATAQKFSDGSNINVFFGPRGNSEAFVGEETISGTDGQHYEVGMSGTRLADLRGTFSGFMQIVSDLTQIKQQQRAMLDVANKATDIANRVAAASEELSAQVEQISQGAEMQRQRVESTASAMTEMNSTVMEVARNAGQASDQSEQTKDNATEGADLVNQVVQAINNVHAAATRLQTNMQDLGHQAESIGGVMNVISDIADQTNLLALNAAIEAARAGEAGRGFAVVADEVRKLAEKTMTATQEVGSSIQAIQQSARTNIEEMGIAVDSVNKATTLAHSSGEALQGIVNIAADTSSVVTSIATAAEEQSATSDEITAAVEEISRVVAETSEGMRQSSVAVHELARMAQELNSVMAKLR